MVGLRRALGTAVIGLAVLTARVDAQDECQAATYDVACSSELGVTTPSIMPEGSGNQVWYTYELVAGTTYTFYGMLADSADTGNGIDTPLDDSRLYLYTDNGSGAPSADYVAENDDGADLPDGYNSLASRIVYTATYTGTHFAKMTPYSDGYAGAFDFIFDTTCLISQEGCEEDGGTFGVCSTAPGLENRLKCTEAADGYSLDADGTVMISRTILCDRYHAGGKDFDRADDFRFCTALFTNADESTRNCKRCQVTVVDNVVTGKAWSGCD